MSSSRPDSRPTVVFDIGAVLLEWNPRHLYRKLFADEAAMETFLAEVCTHDWNLSMDGGTPFPEAIAAKVAEFPHHEPLIRAFDERWEEMVPHVIEGTVEILKGLKERGDKVYAITNFSAEKFALALTKWPFLGWFDGVIVSAHEKLLKPMRGSTGCWRAASAWISPTASSSTTTPTTSPAPAPSACAPSASNRRSRRGGS